MSKNPAVTGALATWIVSSAPFTRACGVLSEYPSICCSARDPARQLDKQSFREGHPLAVVAENYELVAALTERFVA